MFTKKRFAIKERLLETVLIFKSMAFCITKLIIDIFKNLVCVKLEVFI
jgi:hypothetical protein